MTAVPPPGDGEVCAVCERTEGLHWRWCNNHRPVARRQPGDEWDPYSPGWQNDPDAVSYQAAVAAAPPAQRHLVGWAVIPAAPSEPPADLHDDIYLPGDVVQPPPEAQQDDELARALTGEFGSDMSYTGTTAAAVAAFIAARPSADTETLAAEIHEAWEFQYDQCDHGTYNGGPSAGQPYAMCELTAARIIGRRAALDGER